MFRSNPEVALICVLVGLVLVGRGWYALRQRSITVKKPIGFPWQYSEVKKEQHPKMFLVTAWGIIVLGIFFLLFPFFVEYFV